MNITNTDIHKIIDDAMEKKDRTVMIFISDAGTTVNVNPIDNHKPHWIPQYSETKVKSLRGYICSECGASSHMPMCYCGFCGEKMALLKEDDHGRD